jgi:hypothetical protein
MANTQKATGKIGLSAIPDAERYRFFPRFSSPQQQSFKN